ncbi:MAG TPA: alpha/beta hydrolase [Trebonia sp.]
MKTEPVVIALPGTLCPPAVFNPLAKALAGEAAVDPLPWLRWPGPWDIPSVASRVAAYVKERYAAPAVVCGHSTGGAIALQLAVLAPETVRGLVLADTGAHMHGHGDVDAILRRIDSGWGEELRAAVLDRSFRELLDAAIRAEYLEWAAGVEQRAAYDVLASQRDLDLSAELAGISQPAIVIHGRYDRARPWEQGRELSGALPNAEFRVLEAGHTPVYETPGDVAAAVRDLLSVLT